MSDLVLLVYGDSLSLPRALDRLSALETWPELLREALLARTPGSRVAVLNRSRGGAPIAKLYADFVSDSVYIGPEANHVLVIQCGIVDCAPRPVPPRVKDGIARLPAPLRWAVARVLHHLRPALLGSGVAWRNTEETAFAAVLREWIARAARAVNAVCIVNIAPTTAAMDAHSPGLAASITAYNGVIARVAGEAHAVPVRLIDVHGAISGAAGGLRDYVHADGHHITAAGHRLYAGLLADAAAGGAGR